MPTPCAWFHIDDSHVSWGEDRPTHDTTSWWPLFDSDAIALLEADIEQLRQTIQTAEDVFIEYAAIHMHKNNLNKAAINATHAKTMRAAILRSLGEDE